MRKVLLVMFAFVAVPASVAIAQSEGLKVTGGGQVLMGSSSENAGPGDTIAFVAQQTGEQGTMDSAPAKGQLQVINRTGGTKFHGVVTCIRTFDPDDDPSTDNSFIRFGGHQRTKANGSGLPFTVDTRDNGEPNQGEDMIYFRTRGETEDPCDDSDPATQLRSSQLARGNVQEH